MSCPLFEEARACRCRAVSGDVVPSLHERERFCRTSQPERCPTYQQFLATGELDEEEYYAIWLTPRPEPVVAVQIAPVIACTL
jgi:hypothetical protein